MEDETLKQQALLDSALGQNVLGLSQQETKEIAQEIYGPEVNVVLPPLSKRLKMWFGLRIAGVKRALWYVL